MSSSERAYVKDVTIALGLVQMNGDLITLKVPNADKGEKFSLVCPECKTVHKLSQKYICEDDSTHGPYTTGQADRGREVNGEMKRFDREAITEAQTSKLPDKEFQLQVHRKADVEHLVEQDGSTYLFRPTGTAPLYGLLLETLRDSDEVVLIAKTNLRKKDSLVQVFRGLNGQLLVRQLIWPEDAKTFDVPVYDVDKKLLKQVGQLLEESVEDFDPEEYKKDSRDRIAELSGDGGSTPKKKVKAAAADMGDALTAAISSAKNKRKTA